MTVGPAMRMFILYLRKGRTDGNFKILRDGGRLDIFYQCTAGALFLSHAIRKDTVFKAILTGPPDPPKIITVDGEKLYDIRMDESTWTPIIKKVLKGGSHPGISVEKGSFQYVIRNAGESGNVYVLEERGEDISQVQLGPDPVFVLGDQVGLPKKDEKYALRYGTKISLGRTRYTAAGCIQIINHWLDRSEI